jgi:hypothetical protein
MARIVGRFSSFQSVESASTSNIGDCCTLLRSFQLGFGRGLLPAMICTTNSVKNHDAFLKA